MIENNKERIEMKKRWVTIRIETKSREFLSKMLVVHELLKNDYGVVVTNKLGLDSKVFPKGVYLINCLFKNGYKDICKLYKAGQKIVLLDEEGLVHLNDEQYVKRLFKPSLEMVSRIYCFGQDQKRIIDMTYPEYRSRVVATGNPRMNLLNEKYRPLIIKSTDKIVEQYGDYILLVSNFTYVNADCSESTVEGKKKYLRGVLTSMGVEDETAFNEHHEYILKIFKSIKELAIKVHDKYPQYNIVIRPHPSEDIATWKDFIKGHERMFVVREGDLNSWLIGAKLILQNSCTSAIESLFLKTPCLSYRPFTSEKYDQPLPNMLSENVFDDRTALKRIYEILCDRNTYDCTKFLSKANYYISCQDSDGSIKQIVDNIKGLDIEYRDYSTLLYYLKKLNAEHFVYIFHELSKKLLCLIPKYVLYKFDTSLSRKILSAKEDNGSNKFAGITKEEIENTLNEISNLDNEMLKYSVKVIGKEFLICPIS